MPAPDSPPTPVESVQGSPLNSPRASPTNGSVTRSPISDRRAFQDSNLPPIYQQVLLQDDVHQRRSVDNDVDVDDGGRLRSDDKATAKLKLKGGSKFLLREKHVPGKPWF